VVLERAADLREHREGCAALSAGKEVALASARSLPTATRPATPPISSPTAINRCSCCATRPTTRAVCAHPEWQAVVDQDGRSRSRLAGAFWIALAPTKCRCRLSFSLPGLRPYRYHGNGYEFVPAMWQATL